jgi:hypothetical protein
VTTFHCPEDFCSTNNTRADTSARSHVPNNIQRKRTHSREAPALASQVTKAKRHLPRVGYINLTTKNSWPPHPLQASLIVRLKFPSRSPLCGALSLLYLSGEALTSLSFTSHSRSRSLPFFACTTQINLVLISSSSTRTGVVLPPTLNDFTPPYVGLTSV